MTKALQIAKGVIVDPDAYKLIFSDAMNLVPAGKTYPDYVFSKRYRCHYFTEVNTVWSAAFLATLGLAMGDEEISFVSIKPHPKESSSTSESFWLERTGYRGAIRLGTFDILQYWDPATRFSQYRSGQDLFWNSAHEFVIFGDSKTWAIYGTLAWDLAVLGVVTPHLNRARIAGLQYISDVDWAVDYWRPWAAMKPEFYKAIKANYNNPPEEPPPSPINSFSILRGVRS